MAESTIIAVASSVVMARGVAARAGRASDNNNDMEMTIEKETLTNFFSILFIYFSRLSIIIDLI